MLLLQGLGLLGAAAAVLAEVVKVEGLLEMIEEDMEVTGPAADLGDKPRSKVALLRRRNF